MNLFDQEPQAQLVSLTPAPRDIKQEVTEAYQNLNRHDCLPAVFVLLTRPDAQGDGTTVSKSYTPKQTARHQSVLGQLRAHGGYKKAARANARIAYTYSIVRAGVRWSAEYTRPTKTWRVWAEVVG